jgi:signal transduction histidine kinase
VLGNEERLTDIIVYPIVYGDEKGIVIRIDDIKERVKIEEMMVQSEKMLSVGGLAAGMAHEINNPLAGILQNVQVIKGRLTQDSEINRRMAAACGLDLEQIKNYMEARNIFRMMDLVQESGFRAAKIVENMLSFSRKSSSAHTVNYAAEMMENTIDLVSKDYRMKKQYDFRNITINRDYPEDDIQLKCEKSEIQQVLLNILKNGAEAMAEANSDMPSIDISIKKQGNQVIFRIKDRGPGIDKNVQKRIFEPFFTTKDVGLGTGLGLSVSYFIITKNHKGNLWVESLKGNGSTFVVQLPCLS